MEQKLTSKKSFYDKIINGCVVRSLLCQREDDLNEWIKRHKEYDWRENSDIEYAWDELGEDVFCIDMIKDCKQLTKIELNRIKLIIDRRGG